ncbi:MAG TPA: DUF4412 domain-containing protein [Chthoniobacterales bacterium]|jgi:hypothetical protein|nr:DUF4412 domain-containing protein [Chthoniobacterales bacterium]
MKVNLLALASVVALASSAHADFTIIQKVEGMGSATEIVMKVKGDKIRVEATPDATTIVQGKSGEVITLLNAKKKFIRMSADALKAVAELATKYGGDTAEKMKLTSTGKKMTINGYEAEEFVAETKLFKASYWIAPGFPDSDVIMKQLQAVVPTALNDLAKGLMDYRDLPGFPLRTHVKTGDQEITSTVVTVKRDALSDAEFVPPKDFQEMKMPNMLDVSTEKTAPAPSAKP